MRWKDGRVTTNDHSVWLISEMEDDGISGNR